VAQLLSARAALYEAQARYEQAEPLRKRAAAVLDMPNEPDRVPLAVAAHRQAGRLYRLWDRAAQAEPHLARAAELAGGSSKVDPATRAAVLTDLGTLLLALRKFDKAEPVLKEVLQLREQTLGLRPAAEQADLADALAALGSAYLGRSRYLSAEPLFKRALTLRERIAPGGDLATAAVLHGLGTSPGPEEYRKAENEFSKALRIREKVSGPNHPGVAAAAEDLAALYLKTNTPDEAEPLLRKALAVREKTVGAGHPSLAPTLHHLANAVRDQGRAADAEPLYKRALAIREKELGADDPARPRSWKATPNCSARASGARKPTSCSRRPPRSARRSRRRRGNGSSLRCPVVTPKG
jgi:tetratricopeptide (TPR) repeat protein